MDPPTPTPNSPLSAARSRRLRARLAVWVLVIILLAGGGALWLFGLRGARLLTSPGLLRDGWMFLAAAAVALWSLLASTPPDAIKLSPRLGKRIVIGVSAALSVAAVFWVAPVLDAGPLRGRLDGKTWLLGLNPYATTPADLATRAERTGDAEARPDALDRAAPDPDRVSLTPPVGQALLAASRASEYLLPGADGPTDAGGILSALGWRGLILAAPPWDRLTVWRLVLAACHVLTVAELVAWLRGRGLSPWWAAILGWHPLALLLGPGTGHGAAVAALFLVAALRRSDLGRHRRAGLSLAAAVASAPALLVAAPLILRASATGERPKFRLTTAWFAGSLAVLSLPVMVADAGRGPGHVVAAVADAALSPTAAPGPLYAGLERLFVPESDRGSGTARARTARAVGWAICVMVGLVALSVASAASATPATASYAALVAGLLAAPAAPAWALLWPLALASGLAGRGGLTVLVWAGTAALDAGAEPVWSFAPTLAAAGAELSLWLRDGRRAVSTERARRAGDQLP